MFTTLTSKHKKGYGDPKADPMFRLKPPVPALCAEEVFIGLYRQQCDKHRGCGEEQAYCELHSKGV